WSGPSFSSTLQNPAISSAQPSASGDYILTATLNGCVIKDTVNVIVNPIPAAPTLSANTPVCTGQDLQLTGTSVSGASFSWTGPGGFTSSLQNPVRTNATTAMAGQYTAHVTAAACVSADAAVNVTVVPAPNILMYLSPNDSICQGSTVNFSTNVTNAGTGATYKWFKNNSPITGATNSTYSTNTAADYDSFFCTITSNGTCASAYTDSSTSITMRVFPWLAPAVSITSNPTTPVKKGDLINFTATPVNGGNTPRYQWKRNNKDVVGAISNVWGAYTLDDRDTICVVLTSSYLCPQPPTAKSNCIIASVNTTSITGINWQNNPPNVYPNPTREKLIIEGITKGTTIQLMDVLGRILISQTATNETELLNTSQLAQGNYLLQLRDKDNNTVTVKITRD
ncbi:MAG: T9SS type A sorting domain-containing protein, partial [Bacteroidetes bacterium]|nr:T9SS type A sorting domain-containing protein [Bacteroidota bacterium]